MASPTPSGALATCWCMGQNGRCGSLSLAEQSPWLLSAGVRSRADCDRRRAARPSTDRLALLVGCSAGARAFLHRLIVFTAVRSGAWSFRKDRKVSTLTVSHRRRSSGSRRYLRSLKRSVRLGSRPKRHGGLRPLALL